ncbi:MAG: hypothetical protein PVH73_08755 [Candidatus Bathyarchaeota archaeon]
MNLAMNKYVKIWIIVVIVLVVAAISDFLAIQNAPSHPTSVFDPRLPFGSFNFEVDSYYSYTWDIEVFYKIKTILSSINATLLVLLLATYVDMYRKIQSEFTFGLIVFSMILLFYALSSNPLLQWLFGYRAFGLGPFAMLPDMFTTFALAVLLYLTMK